MASLGSELALSNGLDLLLRDLPAMRDLALTLVDKHAKQAA